MVAVQMRDGDDIHLLPVYAEFFESNLRSFATIQEVALPTYVKNLRRWVVLR